MTSISQLFDGYSRRARLYPALITLLPLLILVIAWFPDLLLTEIGGLLVTLITSCGLMYFLADFARSRGKSIEPKLLARWGAWPTTLWLRHSTNFLPPQTKARYHSALARVGGIMMPTASEEEADTKSADAAYDSAVHWLKERCRGKEFPLVEKENATYGFRRNLLGMKPYGLAMVLIALGISMVATVIRLEPSIHPFSLDAIHAWGVTTPLPIQGAMALAAISILGWLTVVRAGWVRQAGDQYARALLACCETL